VADQQRKSDQFKAAFGTLKKAQQDVNQTVNWLDDRYYWGDVLAEVRQILIRVEDITRNKFRTDTGVWVENFNSAGELAGGVDPNGNPIQSSAAPMNPDGGEARYGASRFAGVGEGAPPPSRYGGEARYAETPRPVPIQPIGGAGAGGTNELGSMNILFRAVSWKNLFPEANIETAQDVLNEMKASPLFDPDDKATHFVGNISQDDPPGTFTFRIMAKLKRPMKL